MDLERRKKIPIPSASKMSVNIVLYFLRITDSVSDADKKYKTEKSGE